MHARDLIQRQWPLLWSAVLAAVILGPALGPGYVLSYDMVWVPDLALRPDFLGAGTSLPRAVPSDAVVAVLDDLVGGMLLQKLVLLGSLIGAGAGAARLAERCDLGTIGRLSAVTLTLWNPFVAERLWIGQWPVLVAYAAAPWLIEAAVRARESGTVGARICLLLPLAALAPAMGLLTGVLVLAFGAGRRVGTTLRLVAAVLAANAPWLVAGALHLDNATSSDGAASVFALTGTPGLPAPVAALGLGGIWNTDTVPTSATGVAGWVWAVALTGLAVLGAVALRRTVDRRTWWTGVLCWAAGYLYAVGTWLVPGVGDALAQTVPGGGILRDGARVLFLGAIVQCLAAAAGVAVLARSAARLQLGVLAGAVAALGPVALMPDLACGLSGNLRAVEYPAAYQNARALTAPDNGTAGEVLVLPLTSYRAPGFTEGRPVLGPTGRYLDRDFLASDVLFVAGRPLAGEDPRVAQASAALRAETPRARSEALRRLNIRYVVVDQFPTRLRGPARVPPIEGVRLSPAPVQVTELRGSVSERPTSAVTVAALSVAWLGYLGLFFSGMWRKSRKVRSRRTS